MTRLAPSAAVGPASAQEQLELFDAVLRDVSVKVDSVSLEHPLFALRPTRAERVYSLGEDSEIRIVPSTLGCPTIDDKDVLVYISSQIRAGLNAGLKVASTVNINGYDLLRATGRGVGGADYKRLSAALSRLRGATIITRIRTGGIAQESGFGLIDSWELVKQETIHSPRIRIRISDWYFRAIVANEVLTVEPEYFRLSGLSKRLYELVRKHLGRQTAFRIDLEKLRAKSGSQTPLRRFKFEVGRILESASAARIGGLNDPYRNWLLILHGNIFAAYQNNDEGRKERDKDHLRYLRSSRPVSSSVEQPGAPQ